MGDEFLVPGSGVREEAQDHGTRNAERRTRPLRWSRLAWITLLAGLVPTCAGQLLAPVLGVIALLEIRAARGRERGRVVAWSGIAVALAWMAVAAWGVHWQFQRRSADQVARVQAAGECRQRLVQLAEAYAAARADDPAALEGVDPGRLLRWLADEGYCEPAVLRCPLHARTAGDSYRWLQAPPPGAIPPDRCILIYEDRPRHREQGRKGRNVVFNDGRAAFLPNALFRQTVELQQQAIAQALGR